MGAALAEEGIALNVDVLLGPGVNMKRSPLGGRNFEYFSEDPYLAGRNGCQPDQRHPEQRAWALRSSTLPPTTRNSSASRISAEVDERTLREIYLPAFEKAVKQAKPWTVMCAYNKLNGDYCSEHHHLLTEILKEEWGFEGSGRFRLGRGA